MLPKTPAPKKWREGVPGGIGARLYIPVNFPVRNPRPPKVGPPVCPALPIVFTRRAGLSCPAPAAPASALPPRRGATPCSAGPQPPAPAAPARGAFGYMDYRIDSTGEVPECRMTAGFSGARRRAFATHSNILKENATIWARSGGAGRAIRTRSCRRSCGRSGPRRPLPQGTAPSSTPV